jgi:hypothetical protein
MAVIPTLLGCRIRGHVLMHYCCSAHKYIKASYEDTWAGLGEYLVSIKSIRPRVSSGWQQPTHGFFSAIAPSSFIASNSFKHVNVFTQFNALMLSAIPDLWFNKGEICSRTCGYAVFQAFKLLVVFDVLVCFVGLFCGSVLFCSFALLAFAVFTLELIILHFQNSCKQINLRRQR